MTFAVSLTQDAVQELEVEDDETAVAGAKQEMATQLVPEANPSCRGRPKPWTRGRAEGGGRRRVVFGTCVAVRGWGGSAAMVNAVSGEQ